ncbi:MAG TPA: sialidase family protein, partial [Candidatus Binatus sp.]|nr:sialidase family protein [Candidatus Binatus sp.]
LVQANRAPEILYNNLVVGDDDTVYLAWSNLDAENRAQIYLRTISADGRTWSPIQQVSNSRGNAGRMTMALRQKQLQIAWTETDGESSQAVMRTAEVRR